MRPGTNDHALPFHALRLRCDPASLDFETTASLPPPARMVGQDRAAEALDFGLGVPDSHYNIFVAGPPGSGRSVATSALVEALARTLPTPADWCYVANFETPYTPIALSLPAGRGKRFAHDVADLVERARLALRQSFESATYRQNRDAAVAELETTRRRAERAFEQEAASHDFAVQPGDDGPNFVPLKPAVADTPREIYAPEEFERLAEEIRDHFRASFGLVQDALARVNGITRDVVNEERDIVRQLERAVARDALAPLFVATAADYQELAAVTGYLDRLREDMVGNAALLRLADDGRPEPYPADGEGDAESPAARAGLALAATLSAYRVNILVDNAALDGAPRIHEHNPTAANLAGRLEYGTRLGNLFTDFTFIKAGALHRANGGFLVLHARELLQAQHSWGVLKRALRTGQITIDNPADAQQPVVPARSLKPEPIPLAVKVVMLGDLETWGLLTELDPDFAGLFKVRADFEGIMPRNTQTEAFYARYVGDVARSLRLPPLTRAAVAQIVEEGARQADDQTRLTASLTSLRDLVIEAGYWANRTQAPHIDAMHIAQATRQRHRRMSLLADQMDDAIRRGQIMIATAGAVVGQANGLSVLTVFGASVTRPMRLTARVAPGQQGVMAIERETELSGPIHTKGVLTLAGYLMGRFGQEQPLSLAATLAFEQVYEGVDGDSASLAELCVILSALALVPVRQSLAITGSVNQFGDVQPVGSVNGKVEGFFDICALTGLTGEQGVIIPAANARNLMLRLDVIEAVREGRFQVYTVNTVDEAMELLTGRTAGKPDPNGTYLLGTINALVTERLRLFAERVRHYQRDAR